MKVCAALKVTYSFAGTDSVSMARRQMNARKEAERYGSSKIPCGVMDFSGSHGFPYLEDSTIFGSPTADPSGGMDSASVFQHFGPPERL